MEFSEKMLGNGGFQLVLVKEPSIYGTIERIDDLYEINYWYKAVYQKQFHEDDIDSAKAKLKNLLINAYKQYQLDERKFVKSYKCFLNEKYKQLFESKSPIDELNNLDKLSDKEQNKIIFKYIDLEDPDYIISYNYDPKTYTTPVINLILNIDFFYDEFDVRWESICAFLNLSSHYPMYDYDIQYDDIQYEINDENKKILEKILSYFNDKIENNNFSFILTLSDTTNDLFNNIANIINYEYETQIISNANEIYRKLPFTFDSADEEKTTLTINVNDMETTFNQMFKDNETEIKKIDNITDVDEISDEKYLEMNINIKQNLEKILKYVEKNYEKMISNDKLLAEEIFMVSDLGNKLTSRLLTPEFQNYFINKDNNIVENYKKLENYIQINPTIKKKYYHKVKAAEFNL